VVLTTSAVGWCGGDIIDTIDAPLTKLRCPRLEYFLVHKHRTLLRSLNVSLTPDLKKDGISGWAWMTTLLWQLSIPFHKIPKRKWLSHFQWHVITLVEECNFSNSRKKAANKNEEEILGLRYFVHFRQTYHERPNIWDDNNVTTPFSLLQNMVIPTEFLFSVFHWSKIHPHPGREWEPPRRRPSNPPNEIPPCHGTTSTKS